jgi:GAF domain-containing protein
VSGGLNLRLLDVLSERAEELCKALDADAVAISRVIGDVLILIVERVPDGVTLQQGAGYLIPDYPQTEKVLETGSPLTLTLDDVDVDESEARLLRELNFGSLAMLPLHVNGEEWGLIEAYRLDTRPFTADEVRRAVELSRVS